MRTRTRALVVTLGLVLAIGAIAKPASAAPANKASEECIKLLEDGGGVNDCQEAPSPLKPETNEILWGSAAFLVLLVAMWKFGVPAVKKMEAAREDRIRTDLEAAESAKNSATTELAEYRAKLSDAQSEANAIIDEARQSAEGVRRDLIARAEADAAEVRVRANDEVRLASERALADLRQQVGVMSVDLAGKIVERNLDAATQQQLIDSYIASVGSN